MNDAFFIYEYTTVSVSGFWQLLPADGAEGGEVLTYDQLIPASPDDLLVTHEEEEEENDAIPASTDLAFDTLADMVEQDDGAVLTAFGEETVGTDGGDLLIGDGGIDAGVIAELLAGIGEVVA